MSIRLPPGSTFAGDYRVVQPLGQGGMGSVYIVEQKSTGALRALKLMLPHLAADADARARFEREAKVGSRIPSDHVVHVIAAGFDEQTRAPWIAMELLEGESLQDHVRRTGPVSISDARDLFAQLGHALGAAHGVDVVHRDLKPENLHVGAGRRAGERMSVKVLDFGIAKLVSEAAEGGSAATAAIGTLAWMAPEQTDGSRISVTTDVWSLGLVAFWAFTGKSYWLSVNAGESSVGRVVRELVLDPLVPASERALQLGAPELPAGFDGWFARAVVRDPKARFRDGGEACAALVAMLGVAADGRSAAIDMANAPTDLASGDLAAAVREKPRRRGRLVVIALGVAAAAGLTIAWSTRQPGSRAGSAGVSPSASSSVAASTPVNGVPITSLPRPACSNAKALGLYGSALQAMRDANWDHAEKRLREAAALDASCAMIQLRLAEALSGEEAAASYQRAVELRVQMTPRDRALLDVWGAALRIPRNPAAVEEALTKATLAFPGDAELLEYSCANTPNDGQAIQACRKATEIDPEYADAWSDLGRRLTRRNRPDEAIAAFDRCLAVSPTATDCRTGRANLYDRTLKCPEREADLRQAAASNPTSSEIHLEWAFALADLDRPRETVLEVVRQSIALMPEERRAIDGAFQLWLLAGRYGQWAERERLIAEVTRALATSSNGQDQRLLAARHLFALLQNGAYQEAGRLADEYLKRREAWGTGVTSDDVLMQYARFRAGKISRKELDAFRLDWAARASRDEQLTGWDIWGFAYVIDADDPEQSVQAIAHKPEGDPNDFGPELGRAYAFAGRFAEALPLLRANKTCSQHGWNGALEPLAMALEGTGDVAGACDVYTRIVERFGQHGPLPLFVKRAKDRRAKLACK